MIARLEFGTPVEVDCWCMKWLASRGYKVATPGEWMTPKEFCAKAGITPKAFNSIRHRNGCPDFETAEGPTGRLIRIKATDDLVRFCRTHK